MDEYVVLKAILMAIRLANEPYGDGNLRNAAKFADAVIVAAGGSPRPEQRDPRAGAAK